MTSEWPTAVLADHVDLLTGFPFSSSRYTDDQGGVRLLRGDNIAQGRLRWDGAKRWPSSDARGHERYELRTGDIVLAMDRPWIEAGLKHAVIGPWDIPSLLVQRVARLRARKSLDQRFLRQLVASRAFTEHILAVQTGTAVPHISGPHVLEFRFHLPPMDRQVDIARTLSALDDKVASNNRIRTLVDAMVDSRLDTLLRSDHRFTPVPLGEVAEVNGRTIRKGCDPGVIAYADIGSVISPGRLGKLASYAFAEAPGRARRLVKNGDILWSMVRPNRMGHALLLAPPPNLVASTGFAVITPEKIGPGYLYSALRRREFVSYLESVAQGSAYPAVKARDFETALVPIPDQPLMESFETFALSAYSRAAGAGRENDALDAVLSSIRDPMLQGNSFRLKDLTPGAPQ